MEIAHALDGLDDRPWSAVSHAYGAADGLPDLLRALAGPDDDAADEALSELYGCVLHQGTVYAATVETVPFLARIAAAGHRTADVLALLGGMAESEDDHAVAPGAVREAVARQVPLLLPLLDADERDVRRWAAWAVAHSRASALVLPALRARWEREHDPAVRAEVLTAIARLDPALGAETAAGVLDVGRPAELRLAAVFAALDAGVPWSGAHHTVMLSVLPADPLMSAGTQPERGEPLCAVVEALLGRGGEAEREAAFALLDEALRDVREEVRSEARWAADRACMLSRSAPRRLLPGLLASVGAGAGGTPDERGLLGLASLFERLGPAAAQAAPALAPLAGRNPDRKDDHADRVLAALVLVAPADAVPLLARALGRRPRALNAAAGLHAPGDGVVLPYDDGLLDAVRRRLRCPDDLVGNEPWQLTRLLTAWGVRSAAALPELRAVLTRFPTQVAPAVAAIAAVRPPGERAAAAEALRPVAEAEPGGDGALIAAKALHALTGDDGPLLRCLARRLSEGPREVAEAASAAAELGPRAVPLAPALRAALSGPDDPLIHPVLDADTAIAGALCAVEGDTATAVAVLDSVLARTADDPWACWTAGRAARAAARTGPAGRPLTARLEALLTDPGRTPAAVLALCAVADPATLDRPALASAVLEAAEQDADPTGALDVLEVMGIGALPADCLRRLERLAEGDARIVRSGLENRIIRQDEAFRLRARALLASAGAGQG
ncbi:hypothetical protein [Streptomyces abyssomicinicus]|uniref:hypothetical protein n=1 Tax=Streptomyces abyssomicinicus TaxID=574929 RepID=UPI001FE34420|nr:hypothetical protein [Streptomyces abyssomicinicus]